MMVKKMSEVVKILPYMYLAFLHSVKCLLKSPIIMKKMMIGEDASEVVKIVPYILHLTSCRYLENRWPAAFLLLIRKIKIN